MKRIYIVRHGKAEDGFGKSDYERDLIPKGVKKTEKMADFLISKKVHLDLVLTSMANRAHQTAEIIVAKLGLPKEKLQLNNELYLAASNSILEEIYAVDDAINDLMIVGHNPGISSLATYLSKKEVGWLPTSAVVAVELKADRWNEIPQAASRLYFYRKPTDLV